MKPESRSTVLGYAKNAVENQNNRDRVAAFLEMNKPKKFSANMLSKALNLPVSAIAIALREQPKISSTLDNPTKYFWVEAGNKKPENVAIENPRCPRCDGVSIRKGQNHLGKYRYICKACKKGFNGPKCYPIPPCPNEPKSKSKSKPEPDPKSEPNIEPKPVEFDRESYEKLLELCRHKTFVAVRSFRSGSISEAIAKKITKKAFPDIAVLPINGTGILNRRSLVQNSSALRLKVYHAVLAVEEALISETIAHLISYIAFPDGED